MGSNKKDGVSVLVDGGVSALPPPFLKVDSDITWTCIEEKQPRLLHALGEGFLPAKNPSTSFGLPWGASFPYKRRAKATKEGRTG